MSSSSKSLIILMQNRISDCFQLYVLIFPTGSSSHILELVLFIESSSLRVEIKEIPLKRVSFNFVNSTLAFSSPFYYNIRLRFFMNNRFYSLYFLSNQSIHFLISYYVVKVVPIFIGNICIIGQLCF